MAEVARVHWIQSGLHSLSRAVRRSGWASKPSLLILLASSWMVLYSTGGPYIVYFVDSIYPFHALQLAAQTTYAWSGSNLGLYSEVNIFTAPFFLIYSPLQALSVPDWVNQTTLFVLSLWIGGYGMFRLLAYLFQSVEKTLEKTAALLGASIFYIANPVVTQFLFLDGIPEGPILLATLPWQLLLLMRVFDTVESKGRPFLWQLAGFAFLSLFTIGANEPFNVNTFFLLIGFSCWRLVSGLPSRRQLLLRLATSGCLVAVVVLANWFWIYPELFFANTLGVGSNQTVTYANNLITFRDVTSRLSPLWALELRGIWQSNLSWYGPLYDSASLISLALLPLSILVLLPLLGLKRFPRFRARGAVLTCAFVLLVTTLAYSGVNAPGYSLGLDQVFTNPYVLQLLRNSGVAVGFAIATVESIMIAGGAMMVISALYGKSWRLSMTKFPRKSSVDPPRISGPRFGTPFRGRRATGIEIAAISVPLFLIVPGVLPAFAGALFAPQPYQSKSDIPQYEVDVSDYINRHAGNAYTFLVPGGFQEQNWTAYGNHGYDSFDMLIYLIQTPLIYSAEVGNGGIPPALISQAYDELQLPVASLNYASLLSAMRVEYVVVESGIGTAYPIGGPSYDNATHIEQFLQAQANISWVATFGLDQVFQNEQPLPDPVFVPSKVVYSEVSEVNITKLYYAASTARVSTLSLPSVDFHLSSTGVLDLGVPRDAVLRELNQTGNLALYNDVPMGIQVSSFPELNLTVTSSKYTAISVGIVYSNAANESTFESSSFGVWPFETPEGNAAPVPGFYYAPTQPISFTIDLSSALSYIAAHTGNTSVSDSILNYLYVTLTTTNLTGQEEGQLNATTVEPLSAQILGINLLHNRLGSPTAGSMNLSVPLPRSEDLARAMLENVSTNQTVLPVPAIRALSNGTGFSLTANTTEQADGFPPTGSAVFFNNLPLNVNVSTYRYLLLRISTNRFTALGLGIIEAENLTPLAVNESSFGIWPWTSPPGNAVPVPGFFYSPGANITVVVDLYTAAESIAKIANASGVSGRLDFFFFRLAATYGNSTEVTSGNGSYLHNLSATVESAELTNAFFTDGVNASASAPEGMVTFVSGPPAFNPATEAFVSGETQDFPFGSIATPTTKWTEDNPTSYSVTLGGLDGLVLVVLMQRWDPGWTLTATTGPVGPITHVLVDGYANGWILNYSAGNSPVVLLIQFDGQGALNSGQLVSSVFWLGLIIATAVSYVLPRLLRSKSSRIRGGVESDSNVTDNRP